MNKRIQTTFSAIACAVFMTITLPANAADADPVGVKPVTDTATDTPASTASDPLEGFNRAMFTFNEKLDKYVLKPVATFYNLIMPKPLNQGVHNFFLNIGNLPVIANDILQANFYQMANDMWRLGVNTTVGIGGLFDIAERINLKPYSNDFGLTLAKWGYHNSTYIVLPFWGPRTIRDGIGIPVDYYGFSIYPYIHPDSTRYELYGLSVIDWRAQALQYQDVMDQAAVDRYVFMRDAYLQRRAHQIEENDHRSYADIKEANTPVASATVDSNHTTVPDDVMDTDSE
jgi:phospholipid-binding lipoprotein MlaA